MIWRWLPTFFFVVALILFGAAGYGYYLSTDTHGAVIDQPDRELTKIGVGKNEVRFKLQNPTMHTVRVVGCRVC
jgi:hypothetical protein